MLKLPAFLLSLLLGILPMQGQTSPSLSTWMSQVADVTPVRRMSIPGSHDSGAVCGHVFFKVQDMDMAQQMKAGVRFFDVRLKAECAPGVVADDATGEEAGRLGVYHSGQYMEQTWEADVLPTMLKFLEEHPGELLIVLLKCEGGSREAFARLLGKSLAEVGAAAAKFAPDLTIGESRGRILFLLRDAVEGWPEAARCEGWADNATFRCTLHSRSGETAAASVEDEYAYDGLPSARYKTLTTLRHIAAAAIDRHSLPEAPCWYISYASCHAVPNNSPEQFADIVNPALQEALPTIEGPLGIVLIDFCKSHEALVRQIVERNFVAPSVVP